MKKIIVQILLFVIIFNSIFNVFFINKVIATSTNGYEYTEDDYNQADNEGTTNMGATGEDYGVDKPNTQSTMASIIGNLAAVIAVFPMVIIKGIDFVVSNFGYVNWSATLQTSWLTIQNIVFGNYYMLNANVFKNSMNMQVADKSGAPIATGNAIDLIKENVAEWYYILKLLSLAIGLLTLIYIGIRMAISTVASDQAKYKKMLIAWVQSIGLILVLPYIMRGLNYINEILLDFACVIRDGLISAGGESFEDHIIENIGEKLNTTGGAELAAYAISYIVLMYAEFKFLMLYIKRFFSVSFLTMIAPLISITYSIDKAGDGKAQAFSAWMEEYMVNMLVQPLQAFVYLIFVFSATEIAKAAPIVGIIFLFTLTRAEKIVRIIFNIKNLVSSKSMSLFNKKG